MPDICLFLFMPKCAAFFNFPSFRQAELSEGENLRRWFGGGFEVVESGRKVPVAEEERPGGARNLVGRLGAGVLCLGAKALG